MKKIAIGLFLVGLLAAGPVWAQTTVTFGAIDVTGDTYQLAIGWSNAIKATKTSLTLTPIEGGGTVKLLRGLAARRWDIAVIASPHYMNAVKGTLQFAKEPADLRAKYKDVRSLFGITSGMAQYVVRADSGFKTIPELKGKRVGIGTPGGMAGTVTQALFKDHGLKPKEDYQPEYLNYTQAMDEMRGNKLNCALVWGGVPHAAVYNFSRQIPASFLTIDQTAFENFKKNFPEGEWYVLREYSAEELKKFYGDGVVQTVPARFWTFQMQVVVRADMPEAVAYELVKIFWENLGIVKSTGAALAKLNKDDGLQALAAKIHPGAMKYYRERGWLK